MNKDNAKDYLPLVKALSEARLEFKAGGGDWVRATEHNISFSGPPTDYRIIDSELEPEKWVACGNPVPDKPGHFCNQTKGHLSPCGAIFTTEPPAAPTCVHCGKDPFVKSQEDLDKKAYNDWAISYKGAFDAHAVYDSWNAALDYARKDTK